MDFELARFNMIEQQIRPADVNDPVTLEALALVRRERFVPAAQQALAFADLALPLPGGEHMLQPTIAARVLQAAAPRRGEAVLEIGSGSGYLSALLAVHAETVLSLEIDPQIAALAREHLALAGVANVEVREADGMAGDAGHAPYDLIVATAGVTEVPAAWLAQLKFGGRLFAFIGSAPVMTGYLITRIGDAEYSRRSVFDTRADALRAAPAAAFSF